MKLKELKVRAFETPSGEPTCSLSIEESCTFLGTTKLGLCAHCLFCGENLDRGYSSYGEWGTGYLIPSERCPLLEKNQDVIH